MPTKTEQADLFQAIYGRNGEAPVPVLAAKSPSDAFATAYEACKLAIEHMTPVMILSDGYIANGAEPWQFPQAKDLKVISPKMANPKTEKYLPYERDENGVRKWAIPGTAGLEHRLGGLEKEDLTGNVSYDPENHELMVYKRAAKVKAIENFIPDVDCDVDQGDVLILGWGSTFGAIKTAVAKLKEQNVDVHQVHLRHLNPLPKNLGDVLSRFDHVLIPEMNGGQLVQIIRAEYLVDAKGLNKIQGQPFLASEIEEGVEQLISEGAKA